VIENSQDAFTYLDNHWERGVNDETPTYLTVPEVLEIHAQVMESMNSYAASTAVHGPA